MRAPAQRRGKRQKGRRGHAVASVGVGTGNFQRRENPPENARKHGQQCPDHEHAGKMACRIEQAVQQGTHRLPSNETGRLDCRPDIDSAPEDQGAANNAQSSRQRLYSVDDNSYNIAMNWILPRLLAESVNDRLPFGTGL